MRGLNCPQLQQSPFRFFVSCGTHANLYNAIRMSQHQNSHPSTNIASGTKKCRKDNLQLEAENGGLVQSWLNLCFGGAGGHLKSGGQELIFKRGVGPSGDMGQTSGAPRKFRCNHDVMHPVIQAKRIPEDLNAKDSEILFFFCPILVFQLLSSGRETSEVWNLCIVAMFDSLPNYRETTSLLAWILWFFVFVVFVGILGNW